MSDGLSDDEPAATFLNKNPEGKQFGPFTPKLKN